jgi:hypothetical protein
LTLKAVTESIAGFFWIIAGMAGIVILGPIVKLWVFHRTAWQLFKTGQVASAAGVCIFGCILPDAAIVCGLVLLAQGEL